MAGVKFLKHDILKPISAIVLYVFILIGLYLIKNAWITIGLYHLGITGFLMTGSPSMWLKRLRSGWNSTVAVMGITMSVIILPVIFIFWKFMYLKHMPLDSALTNLGLRGTSWFFFMLYFSTVQPVLEELYWRGYLGCNDLRVSWTDFAFAGYHILVLARFIKVPWLAIAFVILTMVAYIWRYISFRFGGLIIPLLSHIVADISIVFLTYILIQ